MWLLDLFGSGLVNLKSQNLKSVLPCACFHGFFSQVLGFPVTMLHTIIFLHLRFPWVPVDFKVDLFDVHTNTYCSV